MLVTLSVFLFRIFFHATFAQSFHIHHGFLLFEDVEAFGQDSRLVIDATVIVALPRRFGRSAKWRDNIFIRTNTHIITVHAVLIRRLKHHVVSLRFQDVALKLFKVGGVTTAHGSLIESTMSRSFGIRILVKYTLLLISVDRVVLILLDSRFELLSRSLSDIHRPPFRFWSVLSHRHYVRAFSGEGIGVANTTLSTNSYALLAGGRHSLKT